MFLGLWDYKPSDPWRKPEDCGLPGMARDFAVDRHSYSRGGEEQAAAEMLEELSGVEILLAYYDYEDYSGSAFVLFRKDGKLFEVNGGHCSCYGLEGQWTPEETTAEALVFRMDKGDLGVTSEWDGRKNLFRDELREVLRGVF